jgi:hypothetical protein
MAKKVQAMVKLQIPPARPRRRRRSAPRSVRTANIMDFVGQQRKTAKDDG